MITLPITYTHGGKFSNDLIVGAKDSELAPFGPANDPIRQIARAGIRTFVESKRDLLTGSVLDFGCGKPGTCRQPQPYRDLCPGDYVGYDIGDDPYFDGRLFDAVLCTEVLPYLEMPDQGVYALHDFMAPGGHIILTATPAWPEIETNSLWRFTMAGLGNLLARAGFVDLQFQTIARLVVGPNTFNLVHGVVARKP